MCNDTINAILYISQEKLATSTNVETVTIMDLLMPGESLYVVIVLLFLLILSCLSFRLWRKMQRLFTYGFLLVFSGIVFLAGTAIYTVGALQSDQMGFWDAVYTIPSAIISSLGMFVYQDDISELSDRAKQCSEFMASYSIVHLCAAIITSLIMIRWVGMLAFYKWRLWRFNKESSELYILWGINPASLSLARSIRAARPKEEIVFVDAPDEDDDSKINLHRLLDIIKLKDDVDSQIVELDATVVNCHADVTNSSLCNARSMERFFKYNARLWLLSRLVKHAEQLHIFLLSYDETKNINATRNFANIAEKEEARATTQPRETHIYCHARSSALTQVFETKNLTSYNLHLHLHVIDSSKLSVLMLKKNIGDCPISFVDIDKDHGTVCSAFRSMIIGFGETGEEAFKFLYEFGAFIDKDGKKSPFKCTIVDKNATALKENLLSKCPSLPNDTDKGTESLRFVNAEMGGEDFWPMVEEEVKAGLNYLVIAINDDMTCINTAMEIAKRAIIWRATNSDTNTSTGTNTNVNAITKRLNIYVRCYDPINYAQMVDIAHDMQGNYENITVKVFGGIEEIFNYQTIVDDTYLNEAKRYNWEYSGHSQGSIEQCWIKGLKLERTRQDPEVWNVKDSQRLLEQNLSNALHKETKLYLLMRTGYDCYYWASRSLEREENTTHYIHLTDKEQAILLNIARLEHERWVASMKLQGWTPTPKSTDPKNLKAQKHNDMRPWDELRSEGPDREEVQSYDCAVVDTSIRLYLNSENVKYSL